MIRSLAARNALSALLFVVAVIGIGVQLHNVRQGLVGPETRLVLVAYVLIAIYALAAIVVRLRASGKPRR
jgi:membrane protein DedA with SNARE-associated domain